MTESNKKRSGCMVALLVVAGIGAVAVVALIVAGYFFIKSERGKELVATLKDTTEWAMEAMKAPGTDAMREIGCEQPMVTTVGRMMSTAGGLASALDGRKDVRERFADVEDETLVLCNAEAAGTEAPACSALASTFASAVTDPPPQMIVIARNPGEVLECKGYYDREGNRIGGVGDDFSLIPE